jgi:hypothetical protein
MSRILAFEEFWQVANPIHHGGNGLYYHPCCNIWTTRASKSKRASHTQHLQWRQIMDSLPKDIIDKKQALQAKMIEEGWSIPVLLNEACKIQQLPHIAPPLSSDSSSGKPPQQDFPLQSGAFTISQPTGFIIPPQPTTENFQHKGFIEPGKHLDTVSLNSFSLPARSQTVSQE